MLNTRRTRNYTNPIKSNIQRILYLLPFHLRTSLVKFTSLLIPLIRSRIPGIPAPERTRKTSKKHARIYSPMYAKLCISHRRLISHLFLSLAGRYLHAAVVNTLTIATFLANGTRVSRNALYRPPFVFPST